MQPTDPKVTSVVGLLFSQELCWVLLIAKDRPEWQRGQLNGVGGKVEPGEEPAAALSREFLEEVGIAVPPEDWVLGVVLHGGGQAVNFYWSIGDPHDAVRRESERPVVLTISEAIHRPDLMPNLRWIIPFCLDNPAAVRLGFPRYSGVVQPVVVEDLAMRIAAPTEG